MPDEPTQRHLHAIKVSIELLQIAKSQSPNVKVEAQIEKDLQAMYHLKNMVLFAINQPRFDFESVVEAQCVNVAG